MIVSTGKCSSCKGGEPEAKKLKPIGTSVATETCIGRGKDRTDHAFFQCAVCGSVWVKYEDGGAGGHGRFLKNLTEDLF